MKHSKLYYIAGIGMCLLALSFGGYYEFVNTIFAGIGILIFLFEVMVRKVNIQKLTDGFWFSAVLFVGYGISCFYAVDQGIALLGFGKKSLFFVWGCLLLLLSKEEKKSLLGWISYIGVAMVISSGVAYMIPALREYVFTQNRLAGWFQYANTCGGFLLIGSVILLLKEKKSKWEMAMLPILLLGVLLTGSRSTFLILLVVYCYLVIKMSSMRKGLLIIGGASIVFIVAVLIFTGNTDNIARIATVFSESSTIYGRALYNYDGVHQLIKHPFGLGYLGFFYIQNGIQTGLYSVKYIHNDWLQIGLDIGVIPMLFVLFFLFKNLWKRRKDTREFLVLFIIIVQSFMEFNLEYSIMGLILMLCLQEESISYSKHSVIKKVSVCICSVLVLPLIYVSIPLTLGYMDKSEMALKYYPWETNEQLKLLSGCEEEEKAEQLAKDILKRNKTCSLAYDALGIVAVNEGRYEDAVKFMKLSIENNRYEIQGYQQLEWLLMEIVQQGVVENPHYYLDEYEKLLQIKEKNQNEVSFFGKKIADKVNLFSE